MGDPRWWDDEKPDKHGFAPYLTKVFTSGDGWDLWVGGFRGVHFWFTAMDRRARSRGVFLVTRSFGKEGVREIIATRAWAPVRARDPTPHSHDARPECRGLPRAFARGGRRREVLHCRHQGGRAPGPEAGRAVRHHPCARRRGCRDRASSSSSGSNSNGNGSHNFIPKAIYKLTTALML